MSIHTNDYLTKITNRNKKNNFNQKNTFSIKNSQDSISSKVHINKNFKKNRNHNRLNSTKNINDNFKKSFESKNIIIMKKIKNKSTSNAHKIIISKKLAQNLKKSKLKSKSKLKENKNNNNYHSNDNLHNKINKSFYNISKKARDSKTVNNLFNTTRKRINNRENKKNSDLIDSEHNNHKHNYNYDSQSEKNNILMEENKKNVNNFCYESGSKESKECSNDNKITFKCDDYSLFTFGKSNSFSNSKKSKSSKKYFNNNNYDKNNVYNDDYYKNSSFNIIKEHKKSITNNNYINKLKEENKFLRREIKESNEQINFLMYKIKKLKENNIYDTKKNIKTKLYPPNIYFKGKSKIDSSEKENYNSYNNNENFKLSLDNKINGKRKIRIKKDLLKDVSENNFMKNKLKNEKIKNIFNIKKRQIINNKKIKIQNKSHSIYSEKTEEKIKECISTIKI